MKILLTNDDSHDSPLFQFAIEYFSKKGDLTVVVPAEEQSWKGKAMTRFGQPEMTTEIIAGKEVLAFNGTPADCANVGIHEIMKGDVDLVVSGINLGYNIGLAYLWGSGTVGACIEANIAGKPAIALSQALSQEVYDQWCNHRELKPETAEKMFSQLTLALDEVCNKLLVDQDFLASTKTWNINFPGELAEDWQVKNTYVGHSFYKSVFTPANDEASAYKHRVEAFTADSSPDSDNFVIENGHVSATLLDIKDFGQKQANQHFK